MISTIKKHGDIRDCRDTAELAELLNLDLKTLFYFAYKNSNLYTHYKLRKKNGGFRSISAPDDALKTTCSKLNHYLTEVYDEYAPNSAHGFVRGKTIVSNASSHINRSYVLNLDIEDFFGSINTGRVMGLFRGFPFHFGQRLSSVLAGIVTHNNSLPQGSPCSPVISNMLCLKLDKELTLLAMKNRWRYSRYADDITFTSNQLSEDLAFYDDGALVIGKKIRSVIRKNGFSINPAKTRLASPNQSRWVTGIKVNKKLNLSRSYVRKIRSMLNAWEVYGEGLAQDMFNSKYNEGRKKVFREVLRGKIDHLGNVRSKTDLLYRKLYNRLCDLEFRADKRLPESRKEECLEKVLVIKSSIGYGSGFFINKNIIVTCAHVVGDDRNIEYTVRSRKLPTDFRIASRLEVIEELDLAIFYSISDNSDLAFPINTKRNPASLSQEEEYIAAGYGGFRSDGNYWKEPSVVDQRIVNKHVSSSGVRSYQVGNAMWAGMSGGPVVLKSSGRAYGYIVRGSRTLEESTQVISFTFHPISNIPKEYISVERSSVFSEDITF